MALIQVFAPLFAALAVAGVWLLAMSPTLLKEPGADTAISSFLEQAKSENSYVVTLGDSTHTHGNPEAPFSVALARALRERGQTVSTVGMSIDGASAYVYVDFVERLIEQQRSLGGRFPDWIVAEVNPRSFSSVFVSGAYMNPIGWRKAQGAYSPPAKVWVMQWGLGSLFSQHLDRQPGLQETSANLSSSIDRGLTLLVPEYYERGHWEAFLNRSPSLKPIGYDGPLKSNFYAGEMSSAWLHDWRRLIDDARRAHVRLLLYMTPIDPLFDRPEATPSYRDKVTANLTWLDNSLQALQPDRLLDLSFYLQRSEFLANDPAEHLDPAGMRRLTQRIADEIVTAQPGS